jgi:hypothetical protein
MANAWGKTWGVAFGAAFGAIAVTALPPVAGVVAEQPGMGFTKGADLAAWANSAADMAFIHAEDQIATELLVSLITKGFFHGALHT